MLAEGSTGPGIQQYRPLSDILALEMMRVTVMEVGDLSVIMETPGRGPE